MKALYFWGSFVWTPVVVGLLAGGAIETSALLCAFVCALGFCTYKLVWIHHRREVLYNRARYNELIDRAVLHPMKGKSGV